MYLQWRALRKKETEDETQFSLPPKAAEQLVWVLDCCPFVRFSFPVTRLMPYYDAETGRSRPLIA